MKVSRLTFLERFDKAFGCLLAEGTSYLFCFRTVLESGEYFYAAPFVVPRPIELYHHMLSVNNNVIDMLVDQHADVCFLGFWKEASGFENSNWGEITVSFADLFLTTDEKEG